MQALFPAIKPYQQHTLKVDKLHKIYIEEVGDPNGIPIVFIHGGPGAGCSEDDRRFFDPEKYRIILFDQRGCGRSTPHGELKDNTTQHLIEDIEKIRQHLDIDQWFVFGASWGTTLSLVYAQTHPDKVLGMILRSIFLGTEDEIKWIIQYGTNQTFPDYWQKFIEHVPQKRRHELLNVYYELLTGNDEIARMSAAKAWALWEAHCVSLEPHTELLDHFSQPHEALCLAKLECHYFLNQCFLKPQQILNNMATLKDIPAIIIHGRYDMICPLMSAWQLHQDWPFAELDIIRDAGHTWRDAPIADALIRATNIIARRYHLDSSA